MQENDVYYTSLSELERSFVRSGKIPGDGQDTYVSMSASSYDEVISLYKYILIQKRCKTEKGGEKEYL